MAPFAAATPEPLWPFGGVAPPAVDVEAEGVQLHFCSSNTTGYRGVYRQGRRFEVKCERDGKRKYLGKFSSVRVTPTKPKLMAMSAHSVPVNGSNGTFKPLSH